MESLKMKREVSEDANKVKVQTQFRLVLEREAMDALEEMVQIVNSGFETGLVSRSDLATYMFNHAKRLLGKSEIAKIRDEYFDDRLALEKLLKTSEMNGRFPEDLRKILKDQFKSDKPNPKAEP